jgi:hypothetical protein
VFSKQSKSLSIDKKRAAWREHAARSFLKVLKVLRVRPLSL